MLACSWIPIPFLMMRSEPSLYAPEQVTSWTGKKREEVETVKHILTFNPNKTGGGGGMMAPSTFRAITLQRTKLSPRNFTTIFFWVSRTFWHQICEKNLLLKKKNQKNIFLQEKTYMYAYFTPKNWQNTIKSYYLAALKRSGLPFILTQQSMLKNE